VRKNLTFKIEFPLSIW